MSPTDPITPEPHRFSIRLPRPLWIGLAAVVLIVVGVGLRFGIPIYRQQAAIRGVERLGGTAQSRASSLRRWASTLIPDISDRFFVVTEVYFCDSKVTDDDLLFLKELPNLSLLNLSGTEITDAGLVHVSCLRNLDFIQLDETQITDNGLAKLRSLPRLCVLNLDGTQITDAGLEQLKGIASLRILTLDKTKVTVTGVAALRQALPDLNVITDRRSESN